MLVAPSIPGLGPANFTGPANANAQEQGGASPSKGDTVEDFLKAIERVRAEFPAVQKDGYTHIYMGHLGPSGSEALDVTTMQLSLRKASDPENDPLVIVNYTYEGLSDRSASSKQTAFLNKALPILAKRSKRPIVFIEAVAMRQNPPERLYLANAMSELDGNKLGVNDAEIEFKKGGYVLPYLEVFLDGEPVFDASYSLLRKNFTENERRGILGGNLLEVVDNSNRAILISSNEADDKMALNVAPGR